MIAAAATAAGGGAGCGASNATAVLGGVSAAEVAATLSPPPLSPSSAATAAGSGPVPVPAARRTASSTCGSTLYDCVAVVQHMGGLSGGHYIAHCRNRATNRCVAAAPPTPVWLQVTADAPHARRWHTFDDSLVIPRTLEEVARREGYLLFYQRRRTPEFAPAVIPPAGKDEVRLPLSPCSPISLRSAAPLCHEGGVVHAGSCTQPRCQGSGLI